MTFYHRNTDKDTGAKEVGFSSVERNAGASPITVPVRRLSTFLVEEVRDRKMPDKVYGNYTGKAITFNNECFLYLIQRWTRSFLLASCYDACDF